MSNPDIATEQVLEFDAQQILYAAQVAKALTAIPRCMPEYGSEFYVSEAVISYSGERTALRVVADEHGTYSIQVLFRGGEGVEVLRD